MRWETINAYVDGELSPEEARAIAMRAVQDPTLRARIATFSRLKKTTAEAVRSPEPTPAGAPRSYRSAWATIAVGAALLLMLAGALIVPRTSRDRMDSGAMAYRNWLAGAEPASLPRPGPLEIGTWQGSPPDLKAAHLRLVLMVPGKDPNRELLLGYQGPHGCRVGLWISRSAAAAEVPHVADEDIQTVRWTIGGTDFLLLTHGMDNVRLAVLADAVEHLIRDRDQGQVQVALSQSAEIGRPCRG